MKIQDIRKQTPRTNGTRKESDIKYIARHHSATTSGAWSSFWTYWHRTLGWGTGGYHEIILRDGTVQLCYDPTEITNGIAGHNHHAYHICVVGNGSFTAEQERVFKERAIIAMNRFNLPVKAVKGHREFRGANTACPGIDMNKVRASLTGVKTPTKSASGVIGKRVESMYAGALRFYNRPSWDDKDVAGYIHKGYGFPSILDEVVVQGAKQYKVLNSKGKVFYVTASPKFVRVV